MLFILPGKRKQTKISLRGWVYNSGGNAYLVCTEFGLKDHIDTACL